VRRTPTILPLLLALFGCGDPPPPTFLQCELRLSIEPDRAEPGEQVTLTGRPMSEEADTEVRIGGLSTTILTFNDAAGPCATCESCRRDLLCTSCERCPSCAEACEPCAPTVTVEVPDLEPGEYAVSLINRFGVARPMTLEVLPAPPDPDET